MRTMFNSEIFFIMFMPDHRMEDALKSALMIVYQFLAFNANFEILLIEISDKVIMF